MTEVNVPALLLLNIQQVVDVVNSKTNSDYKKLLVILPDEIRHGAFVNLVDKEQVVARCQMYLLNDIIESNEQLSVPMLFYNIITGDQLNKVRSFSVVQKSQ